MQTLSVVQPGTYMKAYEICTSWEGDPPISNHVPNLGANLCVKAEVCYWFKFRVYLHFVHPSLGLTTSSIQSS